MWLVGNNAFTGLLTARDDNPNEVDETEVEPEIVRFWSAVGQVLMIIFEHAGRVVENITIYLSKGYYCL